MSFHPGLNERGCHPGDCRWSGRMLTRGGEPDTALHHLGQAAPLGRSLLPKPVNTPPPLLPSLISHGHGQSTAKPLHLEFSSFGSAPPSPSGTNLIIPQYPNLPAQSEVQDTAAVPTLCCHDWFWTGGSYGEGLGPQAPAQSSAQRSAGVLAVLINASFSLLYKVQ